MTHTMPAISHQIWDMKYRLKDGSGNPVEMTIEDTWRRVARALAEPEDRNHQWEEEFFRVMNDGLFLPAGRIIAGAGTARNVTLFNCFVMGTIPDSMKGIFQNLQEAAITMQQGGGIGYDFSTLRPKGAPVRGVAADASGPLTFMDVWDAMCRTVMAAGSRRGAMMATMRCDHPDIEDFIDAKSDPARLRMFNVSVLVTDPFMEAVQTDGPWDLVFDGKTYRTVRARDLWNRIIRATYDYAEPGVIFIDRINDMNNLAYAETIAATNPCGEQPLPPYGACLLGSINLARLVIKPFAERAKIDKASLADVVRIAVRMMDNVIDTSRFPLPEQQKEAFAKRRIGLGVTGLADAILMLGMRYGSDQAAAYTREIMQFIAERSYETSSQIAKRKGSFPLFDPRDFGRSEMFRQMPVDIQKMIKSYGIRNALLTSIAPTGTISLLAGNVSSGIEPIFSPSYKRKVLQPDGTRTEEEVVDYAVQVWRDLNGDAPLPDHFVDAQSLAPADHVRMQAAAQEWVDSSISKTINCPEDISFEAFKDVYMLAWDTGCKGCTTYRPNAVTGSVLSVESDSIVAKPDEPALPGVSLAIDAADLPERPMRLDASVTKIKLGNRAAAYVTISDIDGQPFEIFLNTKDPDDSAMAAALTRMMSAIFRRGGDLSFVAKELQEIHDPRGGGWWRGSYVPSLPAAIGIVLAEHMGISQGKAASNHVAKITSEPPPASQCPECRAYSVRYENGCATCASCGYSECG